MPRHQAVTHRERGRGAADHRRDRGASAVEYALMLAAVTAVIAAVVFGFGQIVNGVFQGASDCFAAREQQPQPFPDCPTQPVDNP